MVNIKSSILSICMVFGLMANGYATTCSAGKSPATIDGVPHCYKPAITATIAASDTHFLSSDTLVQKEEWFDLQDNLKITFYWTNDNKWSKSQYSDFTSEIVSNQVGEDPVAGIVVTIKKGKIEYTSLKTVFDIQDGKLNIKNNEATISLPFTLTIDYNQSKVLFTGEFSGKYANTAQPEFASDLKDSSGKIVGHIKLNTDNSITVYKYENNQLVKL